MYSFYLQVRYGWPIRNQEFLSIRQTRVEYFMTQVIYTMLQQLAIILLGKIKESIFPRTTFSCGYPISKQDVTKI